ncbi:synaptotagmin-1 [Drosophila sulfurigaster albostrigata]|uniref:Synaptotagmin-1 isoform X2 n=1 Tax=Drosophila albomicans TaxID=7291 RepID=A0A6P8W900_DROAB|nr:synaptotagmin-1 isoform X2 [Drosophila albomicans]XP_062142130.1 synaptotagmin-1 [Drosophila sulfurigaster albostrigata]
MDIVIREEDISLTQIGIYASVSFLVVSAVGAALYTTCSRRYRLNWFEQNLLESASEKDEEQQSREALVAGAVGYNVDNVNECVARSKLVSNNAGNLSPTSLKSEDADPAFWVPASTVTNTAAAVQQQVSNTTEESAPPTPTSPTGSLKSNTLSYCSTTSAVPIARSDKHVVLAMHPGRPRVSSMNAKLDHTKIDMTLYRSHSQPKSSSPSAVVNEVRGNLHVTLSYDPAAGLLNVRLLEAQNLQPRQFSGTADPYAKIRLLPDKKNFWQTRIHKKTLSPVFDEHFVFEVTAGVIDKRTLEILLYDFDAYSRHVCIGGTKLHLAHLDLSEQLKLWTPLTSASAQDMKVDLGDIMVSLAYLPSAERLMVVLIKARNLRIVDDARNSSDPYVKVSLLGPGGKKLKKRKTGVQRNTVNPVYNEALAFDVGKETLKNCLLEFTVVHDSLLGSSEILGRALIGNSPDVLHEEKIFFEEMFRAKNATAQWVPLQEPGNNLGATAKTTTNKN